MRALNLLNRLLEFSNILDDGSPWPPTRRRNRRELLQLAQHILKNRPRMGHRLNRLFAPTSREQVFRPRAQWLADLRHSLLKKWHGLALAASLRKQNPKFASGLIVLCVRCQRAAK